MKINAYRINAFAKTAQGGNPAGVVLNADNLAEGQMKRIAKHIGLSQTAFIMKSDIADFKVRFFTPTEQVDLCGHATIGAFGVMLHYGNIKHGKFTQQTKAGVLKVQVFENQIIMMNQTQPIFSQILDPSQIAQSLNIKLEQLDTSLPIQIVSTGLRDVIIPIKNMQIMNNIKPNFEEVSSVSKKYCTIGYHLFCVETLKNSTAYCRNLAPLYGIPEESATGTSNGALACYLLKHKIINREKSKLLCFQQGYTMGKPSQIIVSLNFDNEGISEVKVGGKSLNISELQIEFQKIM